MKYPIHEAAQCLPAFSKTELKALADDITANGLQVPITVCDGKVIDGRNRLAACELAGVTPRYEIRDDIEDVPMWIWSLNGERRHLASQEQKALIWRQLHGMSTAIQQERQRIRDEANAKRAEAAKEQDFKGNQHKPKEQNTASSCPVRTTTATPKVAKTRQAEAAAAKVKPTAMARATALEKKAPDLAKKVAAGEMKFSDAVRETKRSEVVEQLESVSAREAKEAAGVYDVIVIDPPWPMKKIERDVTPNQVGFEYPTMNEAELEQFRIPAADDCHMWLWTTHKFLPMALRLLTAWKFKYVCTFVWHKPGGFQPFNLPQYNCEFAVYARKGSPEFIDTKAFPVCFSAPRGAHSAKPEGFYDVVRRVTAGRRIDIFNRRAIEGFDVYGNEAQL